MTISLIEYLDYSVSEIIHFSIDNHIIDQQCSIRYISDRLSLSVIIYYIILNNIYIFYSSSYSYTYTRGIWYINRDSYRILTCNIAHTMSGVADESIQRDGNGNATSAFRSTSTPPTSSSSLPPTHITIEVIFTVDGSNVCSRCIYTLTKCYTRQQDQITTL